MNKAQKVQHLNPRLCPSSCQAHQILKRAAGVTWRKSVSLPTEEQCHCVFEVLSTYWVMKRQHSLCWWPTILARLCNSNYNYTFPYLYFPPTLSGAEFDLIITCFKLRVCSLFIDSTTILQTCHIKKNTYKVRLIKMCFCLFPWFYSICYNSHRSVWKISAGYGTDLPPVLKDLHCKDTVKNSRRVTGLNCNWTHD